MYINKENVKISAKEIESIVKGKLFGDSNAYASLLSSFEAQKENSLSFFTGKSKKNILDAIENQTCSILLINDVLDEVSVPKENKAVISCVNAHGAFLALINLFFDEVNPIKGVSEKSQIGENVQIGENFSLGAFSCVGDNTKIGNNVTIHPNVTIYPNCKIGNNVTIHAGAVLREFTELGDNIVIQNGAILGADGFGYVPDPQMGLRPVPQIGNVKLDSFVDIGANACIDRAAVSTTHVGFCTKIDNLVQVGHNVSIGKFSILCGLTGVAGSTQIGNQVTLAGGVGVADHVKIADGVRVAGRSIVDRSINEKGDYMGHPLSEPIRYKRIQNIIKNLPETIKELKKEK